MDKYFICLANSYKRGGRCIAGVEIVFGANGGLKPVCDDVGRPQWIRPIATTAYGEIPNSVAEGIKLFSIVKLCDVVPCPCKPHTENVYYSKLEPCKYDLSHDVSIINHLYDKTHQEIFHNRGRAVSAEMSISINYSLMLIHVENACAYIDVDREKSKNRMSFTYYGADYDFPITDPIFLDEFKKEPERFANIPDVYLTLSLGLEFEGWHHKLVAGVIVPDTTSQTHAVEGVSYMEQQKRLYTNAYAKWTPEENEKLKVLYRKGISIQELTQIFGRNKGAICSRLRKLGIEKESVICQQTSPNWFDGNEQYKTKKYKEAFNIWMSLALKGDDKAQNSVGACYNYGKGVEAEFDKAIYWFELSANQGNVKAKDNLGILLVKKSIYQNKEKAFSLFLQAGEQQFSPAQYHLYLCYLKGIGVEADEKKAIQWLKKAASQKDAKAQYVLANRYREGNAVEKNEKEALQLYKESANQDFLHAQIVLGQIYLKGELGADVCKEESFKWFEKAAIKGDSCSQYNLGLFYTNGDGVCRNYNKAVLWYKCAAKQNNSYAINNLARCYARGDGVEKNLKTAVRLYEKAANLGNEVAHENLRSLNKKFSEILELAKQHNIEAQKKIANWYIIGFLTIRNAEEALIWYAKSKVEGDKENKITNTESAIKSLKENLQEDDLEML